MNKMDDAQKQAFLNAMRMQENKEVSVSEKETLEDMQSSSDEKKKEAIMEKTNSLLHQLYDQLAKLQNYRSEEYTNESWMNFYQAYTYALSVYEMPKPTEEDLKEAIHKVQMAEGQLIQRN